MTPNVCNNCQMNSRRANLQVAPGPVKPVCHQATIATDHRGQSTTTMIKSQLACESDHKTAWIVSALSDNQTHLEAATCIWFLYEVIFLFVSFKPSVYFILSQAKGFGASVDRDYPTSCVYMAPNEGYSTLYKPSARGFSPNIR